MLTGPRSQPLPAGEIEAQEPGEATHFGSGFGGAVWTSRPHPTPTSSGSLSSPVRALPGHLVLAPPVVA